MELHELIVQRREALDLSQSEVGKRAGTNQQTVARIENGSASKHLNAVLDAIGLDAKGQTIANAAPVLPRPEPLLLGARDLPVYAAVEGGPGEMVVSTDAIDMVRRPWFLERVGDAYAVVVTGDSMEPVYEPGDIVLVNPKLPPMRGKDAIFTSEILGGDFRASIKRFVGSTSTHWVARQFNPPEDMAAELRFSKTEWQTAIRVVGKYVP